MRWAATGSVMSAVITSDAEPLPHRCERGRIARHDGYFGALVHQSLDEPEA
jgi:hypothetical protein